MSEQKIPQIDDHLSHLRDHIHRLREVADSTPRPDPEIVMDLAEIRGALKYLLHLTDWRK